MPTLDGAEFAARRAALMKDIGPGAVALLPAARVHLRNRDVDYPYRQDSDFWYLSGFQEPEALLVLAPGRDRGEYLLFCRDRDPEREQWDGYRAGPDGAREQFGADDAFPMDDVGDILPGILEQAERVFYTIGLQPDFDERLIGWLNELRAKARSGTHAPSQIHSLEPLLHDMRLYKSDAEVALMRHAAEVSAEAHQRAMLFCAPGKTEYQLAAEIRHTFESAAMQPAYSSIVGGGEHACILHYVENDAPLNDGDLVLIDAGAEHQHYAADITRTFPVNGRFTEPQRAIYELVLAAQLAAIDAVKPGKSWNAAHEAAVQVLTAGLVDLGLLSGDVETLIEDEAYKPFYMHRTGHWLGMDVHDVGEYKIDNEWRLLEAGMVLTVEPGLYIQAGMPGVDERWWNIGVRIEDDVLVTETGNEVLSAAAPKSVDAIEALMRAA